MRVLLVDDDSGSLHGMRLALTMLRHSCDACSDPVEAVQRYVCQSHDVIITDVVMPMLDGLAFADKIYRINRGARIVFMSANFLNMAEFKTTADVKPVFLRKPIDFCLLKQVLDAADSGVSR